MTRNVEELAAEAIKRPSDFGWWGREEMFETWGWSGINKHRDSNVLEESNFDVVSDDLLTRFPEDFQIVGCGHWAVGHVDQLIVRVYEFNDDGEKVITDAFHAAMEWISNLQDYCVADEDHYGTLRYEATINMIYDFLPSMVEASKDDCHLIYTFLEDELGVYIEVDSGYAPKDEDVLYAAYRLGLIDRGYQEEWDEYTTDNHLAAIDWEKSNLKPHVQIPGQISLLTGEEAV